MSDDSIFKETPIINEMSAICFRKLVFKILAKNTFCHGFIPFISCFITCEENINLKSCSNELYDKLCEAYLHSLNFRVHVGFVPTVCEGQNFEEAACKIAKLNLHPHFKDLDASISLIGLSTNNPNDGVEYCYAPFGRKINFDTYGIYIINNKSTSKYIKDKVEIDKILRELEMLIYLENENNTTNKNLHTRSMKRNNRVFPVEMEKSSFIRGFQNNDEDKNILNSVESEDNSSIQDGSIAEERSKRLNIRDKSEYKEDNQENKINKILPCLEQNLNSYLKYKVDLNTNIIEPDTNLEDKLENHIIVCGYKSGFEYYINAVRNASEVPILIIANSECESKINKILKSVVNTFYLKGNPNDVKLLHLLNIEKAQHVLILTDNSNQESKIDCDCIMIANFLQENYPHIYFCAEVKNRISSQLISYGIFSNENAGLNSLLSLSFMTGKILDSETFYCIGSMIQSNPLTIDFVSNLIEDLPDKKRLIPISVNEYLRGKTYKEVYYEFINDPEIKLLTFGVFSVQLGNNINEKLYDLVYEKDHRFHDDSGISESPFNISINAKDLLLASIPVFKILNPEDNYILITGDILYCYGEIDEEKISNYLWIKKEKEKEENKFEIQVLKKQDSEEDEKNKKRIEAILNSLAKRLKIDQESKLNHILTLSSF